MIRKIAIALALALLAISATVKPAEAQWWRLLGVAGAGWVANNIYHHGMGPRFGYGYNWGPPGYGPPRYYGRPRYGYYGPPPGYYGW